MLTEAETAVLYSTASRLIQDFDPDDSLIYFEIHGILTSHQCEEIERRRSRLEKIRHLFRLYVREAHSLQPMIDFFTFNCQLHLSSALSGKLALANSGVSTDKVLNEERLTKQKKADILLAGQVPAIRDVYYREEFVKEIADALRTNSAYDKSFTILHGMAGSGKTYAAIQALMHDPDLIGVNYRSVYYLDDSRVTPDQVKHLMADLLLMLSDELPLNLLRVHEVSTVALMRMLKEALVEKPLALIFMDDVKSVETVRWLNSLGVRVLATTRNIEIFGCVSSQKSVIFSNGFSTEEVKKFMDWRFPRWRDYLVPRPVVGWCSLLSNNPAVIAKIVKRSEESSGDVMDRFEYYCQRFHQRAKISWDCISTYRYNNMFDALKSSIAMLDEHELDTFNRLDCFSVYDCYIPIRDWCLIIPVEMCKNTNEEVDVYDKLNSIHKKTALIERSPDGSGFKVPDITGRFIRIMCGNRHYDDRYLDRRVIRTKSGFVLRQ